MNSMYIQNDKRALRLYLIIVFALSIIIESIWLIYGEVATRTGISILLMFVPFIAAFITSKKYYKKQCSLGLVRCRIFYIFFAILFPLIYFGLSYGLFWLFTKTSYVGNFSVLIEHTLTYSQKLSDNAAIISALIMMIPITFITAFGEEIGWRGLMYPVMQRLWGYKKALIISGVVWALWHLPLVISGLYLQGTLMIYRVPVFILEIFALTVIYSWVRMKSNSVWTAVVIHAAHNYIDQIIFQSLTYKVDSRYFVGETGMITVAITVIIAVLILISARNVFTEKIT